MCNYAVKLQFAAKILQITVKSTKASHFMAAAKCNNIPPQRGESMISNPDCQPEASAPANFRNSSPIPLPSLTNLHFIASSNTICERQTAKVSPIGTQSVSTPRFVLSKPFSLFTSCYFSCYVQSSFRRDSLPEQNRKKTQLVLEEGITIKSGSPIFLYM